jgi:hypothetical protein
MRKPLTSSLKLRTIRSQLWICVWLFAAITTLHAQQSTQPAPLIVRDLGRATVPIDGPWQFHIGDDLAWSAPAFDDSAWEQIQAGKPWDDRGHWGYTGFAWYRRRIDFAPGSPVDLALFLPNVDSACEVYWNGRLVGSIGKVPPHPVWFRSDELVVGKTVEGIPLGPAQSGLLAIRVWMAPTDLFAPPRQGGLTTMPRIGSAAAVAELGDGVRYEWLRSELFSMAVMLLATIAGVLALLMALRSRENTFLAWLAVAMFWPLEGFLISETNGLLPFRWGYGLVGPLIGVYDAALWFVLIALLGLNQRRRIVQWTIGVVTALWVFDFLNGALQLFDWTSHPQLFLPFDTATTILAVVAELWGIVLVLFAFGRSLDAARWTLALCALAANLYQGLDDLLGMGSRWTHLTLSHYLEDPLFTVAGCPLFLRTVSTAVLLVAILFAAWRYAAEQSQRQTHMDEEYRNAQQVQAVLIPEAIPAVPGFTIESVYKPAGEVGGDFFQAIELTDGGLLANGGMLVVIGDVSGKGMPAAMTVALLVGTFRTLAHYTNSPGEILAAMNQRMLARSAGGFTTCLVTRVDADGTLTAANAGHLSPYLDGAELALENGLPLGLNPHSTYPEATFSLSPNSQVTLITDGVIEAQSQTKELFGFDRTRAISRQSADQIARAALQFGQVDDITVLTLAFAPAEVAHA